MKKSAHLKSPGAAISALAITYVSLSDLIPNPDNPRIHSKRQLKNLHNNIEYYGFIVPVLADGQNRIIAGHGRYQVAHQLGMDRIPVIYIDHLSAEQAQAFMIADNKLASMSKWNERMLTVHLKELSTIIDFDVELTGFTMGEVDLLIESSDGSLGSLHDEIPNIPPGPAVSSIGVLWKLGDHRIYCGNALELKVFDSLMGGKKASMIFTDPPYNVHIDGHVSGNGKIHHREFGMASGEMSPAQFTQFLKSVFDASVLYSIPGSIHMCCMDWRHLPEILEAGLSSYSSFLNLCVWAKNSGGMGSLYRSAHELVLIFKNGTATHINNVQLGAFGRYRTNVWRYGGIASMRYGEEGDLLELHPTVKPIQMVADAILDCSKRATIVLDPFLGSGTTLLAAQQVGRICYAIELDPYYVDIAIRRWQRMTGQDAINALTGETFTAHEHALKRSVKAVSRSTGAHHA
jgi:DNA modification methylase